MSTVSAEELASQLHQIDHMLSTLMDHAGAGLLALYAIGAVVLAAPLAYHVFCRNTNGDCSSRFRRLLRPRPRHIHENLDEGHFRLLHLIPGEAHDAVRIRLTSESIDTPVQYHAVSYAWGDLRDKAYITCEGREIRITKSLFEALKRWRLPDREIVLWADSICINQQNTMEKTRQIVRMTDIYSRAKSVFIWLGSDDAHLEGAERVIKDALEIIPEVVDDPRRNRENAELLGIRNLERANEGKTTTKTLDWGPLRSLLNHTWFERKWVYQEAVLNHRTLLYCGQFEMPFEPLSELALRMATFGIQALPNDGSLNDINVTFFPNRLYNLSMMRMSHWYRGKRPVTLMDGVKATRAFQCTNPRDHILGVLGHATDVEKDSIISQDNLYSLSVQECYLRFTRSQLLEKRDFGILASAPQKVVSDALYPWYSRPFVRWQKRRLPGLPSWVPDLRNQEVDTLPSYTVRYGRFSAGGTETGKIEIINDKIVKCSGMIVDAVEEDGVFWPELPLPRKPKRLPHPLDKMDPYFCRNAMRSLNFYKSCVQIACGSQNIQDMSSERLEAFWKTMTCEKSQLSDRIDVDLSGPVKSMISGMEVWITSEDPEEAEAARVSFVASAPAVEMTILASATPRRFSRTKNDRLCMVPREARAGDVICLFLGSEVPFVIRPAGQGMYELIGDAYVSGIMDGEALASGIYQTVDISLK